MSQTKFYDEFSTIYDEIVLSQNKWFLVVLGPLSQKSESEPSTTKSDNIGHPIVKTGQIWPLGWFW